MNFSDVRSIEDLLKIAALGDEKDNYNYTESDVINHKEEDETPEGQSTPMQTQQGQPIAKNAKLEVLLKSVSVESGSGTTVTPVTCPGVGRVGNHGKDEQEQPACVYNNNDCPYFRDAGFDLDTYYKQITCVVDEKEGI